MPVASHGFGVRTLGKLLIPTSYCTKPPRRTTLTELVTDSVTVFPTQRVGLWCALAGKSHKPPMHRNTIATEPETRRRLDLVVHNARVPPSCDGPRPPASQGVGCAPMPRDASDVRRRGLENILNRQTITSLD